MSAVGPTLTAIEQRLDLLIKLVAGLEKSLWDLEDKVNKIGRHLGVGQFYTDAPIAGDGLYHTGTCGQAPGPRPWGGAKRAI